MTPPLTNKFMRGDHVEKVTGDYRFRGIVVAVVLKLKGHVRYVVENPDGMLFIFNDTQLERFYP